MKKREPEMDRRWTVVPGEERHCCKSSLFIHPSEFRTWKQANKDLSSNVQHSNQG